ncbi:MAG: ribosomal-protein-alanine N-acetyltransferase [Anaerolineales bacterium]|nr:MAG: ribosomal-protein-alanine N-acetyltransferase [Anaerolineales bacterium]
MNLNGLPYVIEPMQLRDVAEVMEIERLSFPTPWSARAYRYELQENNLSHYLIARPQRPLSKKEPGFLARLRRERLVERLRRSLRVTASPGVNILGYGGFWLMAGEAHISTIAVRAEWRRRGIGELLLVAMLERAVELGGDLAALEVRVSNVAAQSLYGKYGFAKVGRRPRYYSDRGEDALIMTTKHLTSAAFQSGFQRLKAELRQKLVERFSPQPQEVLDSPSTIP